jgi:hypothetical protein
MSAKIHELTAEAIVAPAATVRVVPGHGPCRSGAEGKGSFRRSAGSLRQHRRPRGQDWHWQDSPFSDWTRIGVL